MELPKHPGRGKRDEETKVSVSVNEGPGWVDGWLNGWMDGRTD